MKFRLAQDSDGPRITLVVDVPKGGCLPPLPVPPQYKVTDDAMHTNDTTAPSSGADRARRYRVRRAEGRHVARVEVGAEEIEALVANSLLAAEKVGDRVAINAALDDLLYVLSEGAIEIDWDRWD